MSGVISSLFFSDSPLDTGMCFHTKYKVIYVTRGSARITVNGRTFLMRKDDIMFLNSSDFFRFQTVQEPCHRYVLVLSTRDFLNEFKDANVLLLFKFCPQTMKDPVHVRNFSEISALFEKMIAEANGSDYLYSDTLINLYLHELFIWGYRFFRPFISEQNTSIHRKILQAQTILENNFSKQIRIREVCREVQISDYYFTHQFSACVGSSPKQYLTKLRLNLAGILLGSSDLTVSEISERIGFSDTNNFIRCFKKTFQITPTRYRAMYRSGNPGIFV